MYKGRLNYVPHNPNFSGINPPNHTSKKDFEPDRSKYSFYESTINWVYGKAPRRIFSENQDGTRERIPEGQVLNYRPNPAIYEEWQCQGGCRKWFRYEALQIDHSPTIKSHFEDVQPTTWADGMRAYNDVNILRLMCSTCNTCHCWEDAVNSD